MSIGIAQRPRPSLNEDAGAVLAEVPSHVGRHAGLPRLVQFLLDFTCCQVLRNEQHSAGLANRFLGTPSKDFRCAGGPSGDHALRIGNENCVVPGRFHDEAIAILAFAQRFLSTFALADVLQDGNEGDRTAIRVAQERSGNVRPDRTAALVQQPRLDRQLRVFAGDDLEPCVAVFFVFVGVNKPGNRCADQLGPRITQHFAKAAVDTIQLQGFRVELGLAYARELE